MENFEQLFEQYYEDVYRFLRGLSRNEDLAEELTQETFCRAFKGIDTYRGEANPRVWLCSIAKNLFYTHCRRQKVSANSDEEEGRHAEQNGGPETDGRLLIHAIIDREAALEIHRVLHHLREPYKEVFSLRIFGELSFREIGELFEKSEHWACVTYHRARQMIQREMKGDDDEGGM